jgi:hypothetical protein
LQILVKNKGKIFNELYKNNYRRNGKWKFFICDSYCWNRPVFCHDKKEKGINKMINLTLMAILSLISLGVTLMIGTLIVFFDEEDNI